MAFPVRHSLLAIRQPVRPTDHRIAVRLDDPPRDQILQMRQYRIAGGRAQPRIEADIDRPYHRRNVGRALAEAVQDRGLARLAMAGEEADIARGLRNFRAMAGEV